MVAKHLTIRRMACTTSIQPDVAFPPADTTEAVIFDLDDCCSTLSLSFERFSSVRPQACGFVTPWSSTNG